MSAQCNGSEAQKIMFMYGLIIVLTFLDEGQEGKKVKVKTDVDSCCYQCLTLRFAKKSSINDSWKTLNCC